jgi:lysyl-tRNA synthetase class 2
LEHLKNANPNKLLNDLGGLRKKLKLEVPAAKLEDIQGWINKLA